VLLIFIPHLFICLDPPKSISVSFSPSAEIVEGDSVTLSCKSDAKPPALNFSWFKENQSSAVGSGQRFSISSFNSRHSGRYYCEAQNKHGSQRSESVSVSVKESSSSLIRIAVGISAAVVLTSVILMVFVGLLIRRKRVTSSEELNHRGSRHSKTVCKSPHVSSHLCLSVLEGEFILSSLCVVSWRLLRTPT
uniref:Si:ch211-286b5.6 n=1 Tax=Sinocyclocheilus grahami TaxID=75366 RepID=A0A672QZG1_SINGR